MSKIIGFDSAFCRPSTSLSRVWRYIGVGLAAGLAGGVLAPQTAMAQYWSYGPWYGGWAPAPAYPRPYAPYSNGGPFSRGYSEGALRPGDVADLLRSRGWTLTSGIGRSGARYVANVRTGYGQRLFVVISAYDGRILSTRVIEDRPDTRSLAAIPGGTGEGPGDEDGAGYGARRITPETPTPAPKPKPPSPVVRRVPPPTVVKREPLAPPAAGIPDEKKGGIAVVKPKREPEFAKPASPSASPSPSAALTPPEAASPAKPALLPKVPKPSAASKKGGKAVEPSKAAQPGSGGPAHPSPTVRQVYPAPGDQGPVPAPSATPAPSPGTAASASPAVPATPAPSALPTPSPRPAASANPAPSAPPPLPSPSPAPAASASAAPVASPPAAAPAVAPPAAPASGASAPKPAGDKSNLPPDAGFE